MLFGQDLGVSIVVEEVSSHPQATNIGWLEPITMLSRVLRGCGHVEGGPSGVADQTASRNRSPV
jgi:hypothetical protein